MAYSVTFKSLRAGANDDPYVIEIGGSGGTELTGGAQPFVTQEDDTEDVFTPVRTQTGYLRIVDTGVNTFDWKSLIPATDTSITVKLKKGASVMWQGFIQTQTFSGDLYDNPQEREYPVQCALSALASIQAPTNQTDMSNFAALIKYILVDQMPSGISFTSFVFQGGYDARTWLLKKFDWHNFINVTDEGVSPKYNLLELLEHVCRFWGWTCRTWRESVIFTCADDSTETEALLLDQTTLASLANGTTSAGTVQAYMFSTLTIGDDFATVNNIDSVINGISKATVKADCNQTNELIDFAPQNVRNQMESRGYSWIQPDADKPLVGFFTTPEISSFNSQYISGTGYFARRQIYSDEKATEPSICDEVLINGYNTGVIRGTIQTNRSLIFTGGSLKMSGSLYIGEELLTTGDFQRGFKMRIGIGSDVDHAQWFYASLSLTPTSFSYGWSGVHTNNFHVFPDMGIGAAYANSEGTLIGAAKYPSIPITDGSGNPLNMQGKVFVEFLGANDADYTGIGQTFQIANFKLEYSRDAAQILGMRSRVLAVDRKSSRDYKATNSNKFKDEWSTDCIFASDNNMEYGYGLLMNSDGSFMTAAPYGNTTQQPEQHLANRVASYWSNIKHKIYSELQSQALASGTAIRDISPRNKVTIGGITGAPVAISHDWRDDVTTLTVIEL